MAITVDMIEYDSILQNNYNVLETLNKENNLTGALHILSFEGTDEKEYKDS